MTVDQIDILSFPKKSSMGGVACLIVESLILWNMSNSAWIWLVIINANRNKICCKSVRYAVKILCRQSGNWSGCLFCLGATRCLGGTSATSSTPSWWCSASSAENGSRPCTTACGPRERYSAWPSSSPLSSSETSSSVLTYCITPLHNIFHHKYALRNSENASIQKYMSHNFWSFSQEDKTTEFFVIDQGWVLPESIWWNYD